MNYLDWNDAIASHFFHPGMAGRNVYLYVTEELIRELGSPTHSADDFIETVEEGLGFAKGCSFCEGAHKWMNRWRVLANPEHMDLEYPPYIAHLALSVLAAGHGARGEYTTNAYYDRLNDLLSSSHPEVGSPEFASLSEVWEDLERWANEDRQGELGHFYVHRTGQGRYVGIPIAQTFLTRRERAGLERIFAKAGLDPTLPPSEEELATLVAARGQHLLRPVTRRRLRGEIETTLNLREALVAVLAEALEEWDGTYSEPDTQRGEETIHHTGTLFLSLKFSLFGDLEQVRLHCKTSRSFPEEGFKLTADQQRGNFTCEERFGQWSTPIRRNDQVIDASTFDWSGQVKLTGEEQGWTFRLPSSQVRLFITDGDSKGLPKFAETRQLSLGEHIFVAVKGDKNTAIIEEWGNKHCEGFRSAGSTNLPDGWLLYEIEAAQSDEIVRDHFPKMMLPSRVKLSLVGGISLSRKNEYFSFAPPRVQVRSSKPAEVYCNGKLLRSGRQESTFELPDELLSENTLALEVHQSGEVVQKRHLYLHDQVSWTGITPQRYLDEFGLVSKEGEVAGAMVPASGDEELYFNTFTRLPAFDTSRVFLLGKKPGQIVKWPQEPLPDGWHPVWAIPMKKKSGHAVFCYRRLPGPPPDPSSSEYSRKQRKMWREILHVKRRVIRPPSLPEARDLWMKYREVAKDVR